MVTKGKYNISMEVMFYGFYGSCFIKFELCVRFIAEPGF